MQAGDIISLGTFAGEKAIHAGDVVELEVERIGTLRNRVIASKAAWNNFATGQATGPLVKEGRLKKRQRLPIRRTLEDVCDPRQSCAVDL